MKKDVWYYLSALSLLLLLAVSSLGYLGYKYLVLKKEKEVFNRETADHQNRIEELEENLNKAKADNIFLGETLYTEQNKNSVFEKQIKDISKTVGDLDKLSKTDEELLQKYSKVYFLSEHYVPSSISEIDSSHVYNKDKTYYIHTQVLPFLRAIMRASEENGITLKIISAFRSFGEQESIKTGYKVTYGVGTANQFSADQGYSEHQLGTAVDFTTPETGDNFSRFEETDAYQWLLQNAYKYGFIISYPENNEYYQFEPWHWRLVGAALSNKLHIDQRNFYDLSQREIDQYLIHIFDQPES